MKAVVIALLGLAGCAAVSPRTVIVRTPPALHVVVQPPKVIPLLAPGPVVEHVVERTPHRRPCVVPPEPPFADSDDAIMAGPGLIDRVVRLRAGRDQHVAYEQALARALKTCGRP